MGYFQRLCYLTIYMYILVEVVEVVALVLLGVIRPAIKALSQATPHVTMLATPQLDALESEEPERPQLAGPSTRVEAPMPTTSELALTNARKLTLDNPAAVANIMKTWINGEAAA
jgi:flagellar M-ring protein FliF